MKIRYTIVALLILIAAILPLYEFKAGISKDCGVHQLKQKNTFFLYEWLTTEKSTTFIECEGSVTYLNYRAFDVSAAIILIAAVLALAPKLNLHSRKKH